jgi:F plasmid transfer operon, TraF, protein
MLQWFDAHSARADRPGVRALVVLGLLVGVPGRPALAQIPLETAGGTRALGMGGAFTAVADDATATWWNPAGLSTLLADAVIDGGADDLIDHADQQIGEGGAWRARPFGIAVAAPVVGFSFNRLSVRDIRSATDGRPPGRKDPTIGPAVRTFESSSLGVTLVQSLGDWFVVGSTLRLLRAGTGSAPVAADASVDSALDAAGTLDTADRTVADVDVGALVFVGPMRLGIVGRNLGDHRFEAAGGNVAFEVERAVRVGAAFGPGPAWVRRDWTVAVDADLTTTDAPDGERRSLAIGGERWLGHAHRLAVRAGGRFQTTGDARPVASGGASVAVIRGVYVEAQVTGGADAAVSGWTLAGRVTF